MGSSWVGWTDEVILVWWGRWGQSDGGEMVLSDLMGDTRSSCTGGGDGE